MSDSMFMAEDYAQETLGDNWKAVLNYAARLRGGEKLPNWSNEQTNDFQAAARYHAGTKVYDEVTSPFAGQGAEIARYLNKVRGVNDGLAASMAGGLSGDQDSLAGLGSLFGLGGASTKDNEKMHEEMIQRSIESRIVSCIGNMFAVPTNAVPAEVREHLGL